MAQLDGEGQRRYREIEARLSVGDVRAPSAGALAEYIGRPMQGRAGSPLRNPLPVLGSKWSAEARQWAERLSREAQSEAVRTHALAALQAQGWAPGVAGTDGYAEVLRLEGAGSGPVRQELTRLARLVLDGERVELLCWCRGAAACHGQQVRRAVLGLVAYALLQRQTRGAAQ